MNSQIYRKVHGCNVKNDWERVKILASICNQVEEVVTPKPHRLCLEEAAIDYEFYEFPTPLIQLIKNYDVFSKLGSLLAHMHSTNFNQSQLSFEPSPYPLREFGLSQEDQELLNKSFNVGWLHGDFWHGNVFYRTDGNFIILDPIPAHLTQHSHFIHASGALDVAFMRMSLLFCHPLQKQLTIDRSRHYGAAEAFTESYLETLSSSTTDIQPALDRLTHAIAIRYINNYRKRLFWPLAIAKELLAKRALRQFDQHTRIFTQ